MLAEVDGPVATIANLPPPNPSPIQPAEEDKVLAVHVTPSGDVAAAVDEFPIAKKELLPKATAIQKADVGSVRVVQSNPLVDVTAVVLDAPVSMATKTPFPKAICPYCGTPEIVVDAHVTPSEDTAIDEAKSVATKTPFP